MQKKDNYILIGMPGCGKSTIGVLLAKTLGYDFLDTDLVIQQKTGRMLHEIIAEDGIERFKQIEEEINLAVAVEKTVIAPGGSVVYGRRAMEHFSQTGTIVYLELIYKELEKRLEDLTERGVVFEDGQTLRDLYEERVPLYEKYADVIVPIEALSISEALEKVLESLL